MGTGSYAARTVLMIGTRKGLWVGTSDEERAACDLINPPGGVLVNFHNTAAWMKTPVA